MPEFISAIICPVDGHFCQRGICVTHPHNPECDADLTKLANVIRTGEDAKAKGQFDEEQKKEVDKMNEKIVNKVIIKLGVDEDLYKERLDQKISGADQQEV